jgi:hypothetical protein
MHCNKSTAHQSNGSTTRIVTTIIVVVGLVFHLAYVLTIVDVYFRSPLVSGMPPTATYNESLCATATHADACHGAPAKRLVLMVGMFVTSTHKQAHVAIVELLTTKQRREHSRRASSRYVL